MVNYRLHAAGPASVPLTFGTVFRDDDRVRELLREERPVLAERLGAVRGCAEWVVALHLVRAPDGEYLTQASAAVQALRGEIGSASPGRAHLLRRRLAELERDESRRLGGRGRRAGADKVAASGGGGLLRATADRHG